MTHWTRYKHEETVLGATSTMQHRLDVFSDYAIMVLVLGIQHPKAQKSSFRKYVLLNTLSTSNSAKLRIIVPH